MEVDKKEGSSFSGVPPAPPPPTLRKVIPLNDGKNLMKAAATLIGDQDDKIAKESSLDVCQNVLRRYIINISDQCRRLSWFYHNNDVEAFLQDGPTCGLVALKLAADILKVSASTKSNEIKELLQAAQDNGFTYCGEMFSARDMGLLAKKYYELKFEVVNNGLEDYVRLIEHLYRGYPVLVPYDADRNHEPCLQRGHKAHWAVITGFLIGLKDENISLTDTLTDGGVTSIYPFHLGKVQFPNSFESKHLFLLARQGKSRHYAVWPWVHCNDSNKNLFEFDQAEVNNSNLPIEKTKHMFTEGIQTGLCSKVVFLFPENKDLEFIT